MDLNAITPEQFLIGLGVIFFVILFFAKDIFWFMLKAAFAIAVVFFLGYLGLIIIGLQNL